MIHRFYHSFAIFLFMFLFIWGLIAKDYVSTIFIAIALILEILYLEEIAKK